MLDFKGKLQLKCQRFMNNNQEHFTNLRFHEYQLVVNCGKKGNDMKPNAISPNY